PALPEQPAGAIQQARTHLAPGGAGSARSMLGVAAGRLGSRWDGFGSHFALSILVCMIYKQIRQPGIWAIPCVALPNASPAAGTPPNQVSTLASRPKILITRASVDPGRELNGRSQQS